MGIARYLTKKIKLCVCCVYASLPIIYIASIHVYLPVPVPNTLALISDMALMATRKNP